MPMPMPTSPPPPPLSPHRFNNNNIFYSDPQSYLNMNHCYLLCMYIFGWCARSLRYLSLDLRHVLASGDGVRASENERDREREGKIRAHNLIPLTLLFFLVSAQEWHHTNECSLSVFLFCQNDYRKDKTPFILYSLLSVIQFTGLEAEQAKNCTLCDSRIVLEITLSLCGRCAVCSFFPSCARANPNC